MPDFEGLPGRLEDELRAKGFTLRGFHKAVEAAAGGVRGTSYGTVYSYVKEPVSKEVFRPHILEAMAEVLGVRYEYLLEGTGARTEREELLRQETLEAEEDPHLGATLRAFRAFKKVQARLPALNRGLRPPLQEAFLRTTMDLLECGGRPFEDWTEEEMARIMEPLAWLWHLPAKALGTSNPEKDFTPKEYEAYFLSLYQALQAAMPEKGQGDPEKSAEILWRVKQGLGEFWIPLPPSARKLDGMWWYGPFCGNESHSDPNPIMMNREGKEYVCPVCGERQPVRNP